MIKNFLFIFLLLVTSEVYSQDSTFKIVFPEGWVQFQRNEVLNSVKNKFDLPEKVKEELLSSSTSTELFGYAAPTKPGTLYRPNIQVLLRRNPTQDDTQFRLSIEKSLEGFKSQIIWDFKIIDNPIEILIDGRKAVYTKVSGYHPTKTGDEVQVFSRIYAIPVGKYFYQITMNDSPDYNCEIDFQTVLRTIAL